jgi:hypothetical protein
MNYRDFFKKPTTSPLPEGVTPSELAKGIKLETAGCGDKDMAKRIALKHLNEDARYYTKIYENQGDEVEGEDEEMPVPPHKADMGAADRAIGKMEQDPSYRPKPFDKNEDIEIEDGDDDDVEIDSDGVEDADSGLPKMGGALAIPHHGQPIHMSKIIQVGSFGSSTGKPASGALSGYTTAKSPGDKEPLTAGGKSTDDSVTKQSVGGEITNKDAKQEGPNHGGTIEKTSKMNESKKERIKAQILKEIAYDHGTKKWVRLNEGKHKSGCGCGFCKNKGTFGKKKKEDTEDKKQDEKDDSATVDETVNMKMGRSYKVVQPNQTQTIQHDKARENQYDPEITEMCDDEHEEGLMERFNQLANAQRNLSEAELSEMKTLARRFDENLVGGGNGTSYKVVAPTLARVSSDDHARTVQHQPDMTEAEDDIKTGEECPNCGTKNEPDPTGKFVCARCHEPYIPGEGIVDPEDKDSFEDREPSDDELASVGKTDRDFILGLRDEDDLYEGGEGESEDDPQTKAFLMGGQPNRPLQQTEYVLVNVQSDHQSVILKDTETGKHEMWAIRDDRPASFSLQLPQGANYSTGHPQWLEFASSLQDDEDSVNEGGSLAAVQHRSFRTEKDNPQHKDSRWSHEVTETTKKSSVRKAVDKSNKPKPTHKNKLKHKGSSNAKSGVHKKIKTL